MLSRQEVPMAQWQLQEAKQQLSRVVDLAVQEGPQTITRHGHEVAVVVSIEEYRRLRPTERPTLKDVLLRHLGADGDAPDLMSLIPPRGQWKEKPPIDFEE
jgi:prevent-host-death family protein